MSIHVSEKDIRERTLQNNPVPRNVKVYQRLDEYIKELLLENKKSSTLYHEKIRKGIQEKIGPGSTNSVMEFHGERKRVNFTR